MGFLLGRWKGRRDAPGLCGRGKLCEHAAQSRLQAALLGGREVVGQREALELVERVLELVEASLQQRGAWRGRRRRRRGAHGVVRRREQRAAVRVVGDAVRGDQQARLAGPETVPLRTAKQRVLVLVRQRREVQRQAHAHPPGGELALPLGPEPAAQDPAARDPPGLLPQ